MQPNTDSTVRDRNRRLRAAVDRLDREPDADGASARTPAEREPANERRPDETGGVGTETGAGSTTRPSELDAAADRCSTCGTTIGPREYRISRVVEQGPDAPTLAVHYCSEACLSEDGSEPGSRPRSESASGSSSDASSGRSEPRDWSYCR